MEGGQAFVCPPTRILLINGKLVRVHTLNRSLTYEREQGCPIRTLIPKDQVVQFPLLYFQRIFLHCLKVSPSPWSRVNYHPDHRGVCHPDHLPERSAAKRRRHRRERYA